MDSLLFPVKPAASAFAVLLLLGSGLPLVGCGYRPVYGAPAEARLTVVPAPQTTPRLEVVHQVMAGVRRELSAAGALRPGSAYPRVVVEVLRVDELPTGIAALPGEDGDRRRPRARGSAVGVTARAWLVEHEGAEPSRDTGDLRRVEYAAVVENARLGARVFDDAARVAARRVGRALARRILGRAEPSVEPM